MPPHHQDGVREDPPSGRILNRTRNPDPESEAKVIRDADGTETIRKLANDFFSSQLKSQKFLFNFFLIGLNEKYKNEEIIFFFFSMSKSVTRLLSL